MKSTLGTADDQDYIFYDHAGDPDHFHRAVCAMTNNLYALAHYSYDHYEWEQIIAVSDKRRMLNQYYKDLEINIPLVTQKQHINIRESRSEQQHYCVITLPFLPSPEFKPKEKHHADHMYGPNKGRFP